MATATNSAELIELMEQCPTGMDLFRFANGTKAQQMYRMLDEAERTSAYEAYTEQMKLVCDRYKLNDLDGIPLHVDTVEQVHNPENGTDFLVISGSRKDTGETFTTRTRAVGLVRFFKEKSGTPNVDVAFVRSGTNRNGPYSLSSFWAVVVLVPLTKRNPFRTHEDS